MKYFGFLIFLAVVFCGSCKTENMFQSKRLRQDSAAFRLPNDYQYRLRKDDKVNISVWGHDELSVGSIYGIYNSNEVYGKWLLVDAAGKITVPKLGPTYVQGMTVMQLQKHLAEAFGKWILNPMVDVKVLNKEVSVLGEFKSPGKFLIEKEKNPLLEIVSKAGDFDQFADKKHIKIIRQDSTGVARELTIDLTTMNAYQFNNLTVIPGDVIYAPSKNTKKVSRSLTSIIPIASAISTSVIVLNFILK